MAIDPIQAIESEIDRLNNSIQDRLQQYKNEQLNDHEYQQLVMDYGRLMMQKFDLEILNSERNRRVAAEPVN